MLRNGERQAYEQDWWLWPDRPVREALGDVRLRTWLPLVRVAVKKNAQAGAKPGSFRELYTMLGRAPRNVERAVQGKYALTDQVVIGLSLLLGIPVREFLPERAAQWVADAVRQLAGGRISAADARAYVTYRLADPPAALDELDSKALRRVCAECPACFPNIAAAEIAVRRVAKSLAPILERLPGGRPS